MMSPHETKTSVSVIGLGAMGSALARALLDADHPTTVWNRSPEKADELVRHGASHAATAAEAVTRSELVIVCVVDYDASEQILATVAKELSGRVLVNLTSDTPERARAAAEWAGENGIDYLDGAIMVPTVVIGQPEALILYSGSRSAFDAHAAILKALGGEARYLGSDHGAAALYDLGMLTTFYSSMMGIVHAMALVRADGVRATAFVPYLHEIVRILPPIADEMANEVDEGAYSGDLANLSMETAALEHIVDASRARGIDASVPDAIMALAKRAIAAGHGGNGFASTIEVLKEQRDSEGYRS